MKFADLTQVALLGTARQPLPAPAGDGALAKLQIQLDREQRETALLAAAALAGLHEEIGRLPAREDSPPPIACPAETGLRVGARAGSILARLLGGEHAGLLPEWLAHAARHDRIALPESLPALLDAGTAKPDLREEILPVLGERGRWLAPQRGEWAWVTGATGAGEEIWQTGESAARLAFLRRLRVVDPGHARELLAAGWKTETPEDRAAFLGAMEIGLGPEDEPFLEAALDDKRKDVRKGAAKFLVRLPGSALVQRMLARAEPLLRFIPGEAGSILRLKKAKPAQVEVTLPETCDKAMQRDGIEPKPPTGFGEKAWWLIQILEVVPLANWNNAWNQTPAGILEATSRGEWAKEFAEAWTRAAIAQANAGWAAPLFDMAIEAKRFDRLEGLLGAFTALAREARVMMLLATDEPATREFLPALVACCRHDWSEDFSRALLAWLRDLTARPSYDWQLRGQLKEFAFRLAPGALAEAATDWKTTTAAWEFWSSGVDDFLAVTQLRQDMTISFKEGV